jgi:hypothetical protein
MSSIVAVPASTSDSQSRPRAIAATSFARLSLQIGRICPLCRPFWSYDLAMACGGGLAPTHSENEGSVLFVI